MWYRDGGFCRSWSRAIYVGQGVGIITTATASVRAVIAKNAAAAVTAARLSVRGAGGASKARA